jgi:hypothetical protein
MSKLIGMLIALMLVVPAKAQDVPTDYNSVIRTCGAEWRASDTRKATPKGEGAAAWNTFRRDCVAKSGYVSKRNRTATKTN